MKSLRLKDDSVTFRLAIYIGIFLAVLRTWRSRHLAQQKGRSRTKPYKSYAKMK